MDMMDGAIKLYTLTVANDYLGAELWKTAEPIEVAYGQSNSGNYPSSTKNENSPLNDLKIYAGVTYFLPF